MEIKRIQVGGYKNIDNIDIELGKITAFIGLNNFGKTNVLRAIDNAIRFIKLPPERKESIMNRVSNIPINKVIANKNFHFYIEYLTNFFDENGDKEIYVEYEYEYEWPKNTVKKDSENTSGRIVKEVLRVKENSKGKKYNTRISRNEKEAYYKSSETGRCDKPIKIQDNNLILNKLKNYDDLFYIKIIEELNDLKFYINSYLNADGAFEVLPFRFKKKSLYNSGNERKSIAEVIYNLKENDLDRYNKLKKVFIKLFDDIEELDAIEVPVRLSKENEKKLPEDIPFSILEKIYTIRVKNKYMNQYIGFENLSNGTKRIFLFLTSIIFADMNEISVIAFEELENCIHPSLFKRLIELIKKSAVNCKIILTSHSPLLLQYLSVDDIYIGIPMNNGVARFEKIKKIKQKSLENIAESYNIRKGDYIFKLLSDYSDDINDNLLSFIDLEK